MKISSVSSPDKENMLAKTIRFETQKLSSLSEQSEEQLLQRHNVMGQLKRSEQMLTKLTRDSQQSHSQVMGKLKDTESKYSQLILRLIKENDRLRKQVCRRNKTIITESEGSSNRHSEALSQSCRQSQIDREPSQCSESVESQEEERDYSGEYCECPPELARHFGGRRPNCKRITGDNALLRGISVGLLKFAALSKDDGVIRTMRQILENSQMRIDRLQSESIPEQYRGLQNYAVIKSALLSCFTSLEEFSQASRCDDSSFYELLEEHPVYEFLGMLFLKLACKDNEGGKSARFNFGLEEEQVPSLMAKLSQLLQLKTGAVHKDLYRLQKGALGCTLLLSDRRVLVFDMKLDNCAISQHSDESND